MRRSGREESCVRGWEEGGGLGRLYSLAASLFYIQLLSYTKIFVISAMFCISRRYISNIPVFFPDSLENFKANEINLSELDFTFFNENTGLKSCFIRKYVNFL